MSALEPLTPPADGAEAAAVLAQTQRWVERAVIGLNLCPFAKAVHAKQQIRYCITGAASGEELLAELAQELTLLDQADPETLSTTLLVHPWAMTDFLEYNAFLETADDAVSALGLEGVLQVASFHPQYQFEGSGPDDIDNYSNRSPWPTLHLLREESIDLAVDAFPSAEAIFGANIRTLRLLGKPGWRALFEDPGDN